MTFIGCEIILLGVKTITASNYNKKRQLVVMDIKQHRLYYFDYQGTHAPNNAINLEFFDGHQLRFYIKIQLKTHYAKGQSTVFKLFEKLQNGTSFEHKLLRNELTDYWIEPIFGLEVNEKSLVIVDITNPSSEQYKLFTVNTNDFGYFNQMKFISNFSESDYVSWTITAFPLVLGNGKEIIFDPNRNRNYSEAVEYCNSRDTQIILPDSSHEKRNIIDVLKEAWYIGPFRIRVKKNHYSVGPRYRVEIFFAGERNYIYR